MGECEREREREGGREWMSESGMDREGGERERERWRDFHVTCPASDSCCDAAREFFFLKLNSAKLQWVSSAFVGMIPLVET